MPSPRLAKLAPPRASNWLVRSRLNSLLDEATGAAAAWIAAEPGAGKSTLAATWLCAAHAFVVRLERQPRTWRLHDLLRDALSRRFGSIGHSAWRDELRTVAARIALQRGLVREAVRLHATRFTRRRPRCSHSVISRSSPRAATTTRCR